MWVCVCVWLVTACCLRVWVCVVSVSVWACCVVLRGVALHGAAAAAHCTAAGRRPGGSRAAGYRLWNLQGLCGPLSPLSVVVRGGRVIGAVGVESSVPCKLLLRLPPLKCCPIRRNGTSESEPKRPHFTHHPQSGWAEARRRPAGCGFGFCEAWGATLAALCLQSAHANPH